jgi:nucleoid-associated protein YgaU
LAALTQEIDTLLQTEEVAKKKESLAYKKQLMQEVESRKKGLRYIVVKPGDTLSSIAYRAYGRASAYTKIYEANPDLIKNPNKIYVGQRLRVPLE